MSQQVATPLICDPLSGGLGADILCQMKHDTSHTSRITKAFIPSKIFKSVADQKTGANTSICSFLMVNARIFFQPFYLSKASDNTDQSLNCKTWSSGVL